MPRCLAPLSREHCVISHGSQCQKFNGTFCAPLPCPPLPRTEHEVGLLGAIRPLASVFFAPVVCALADQRSIQQQVRPIATQQIAHSSGLWTEELICMLEVPQHDFTRHVDHIDLVDPTSICRYGILCKIWVVQKKQPMKHIVNNSDLTAFTGQHDL